MIKVPEEYSWIKPGVWANIKEDAWHARGIPGPVQIDGIPLLTSGTWYVATTEEFGILMYCNELEFCYDPPIDIRLSRTEALNLKRNLSALRHYRLFDKLESLKKLESALNEKLNSVSFFQLIEEKKIYLDQLVKLGSGWCSGNSIAPKKQSINLMKKLIEFIESEFVFSWQSNYTLLLSPLPLGGVSLELKTKNLELTLDIMNDKTITLEYKKDYSYFETEGMNSRNYISKFKKVLNDL